MKSMPEKLYIVSICCLLILLLQSSIAYSATPQIASGSQHNLAVKSDGTLWTWGLNSSGQLGDGTTEDRSTPVQIGSDSSWTAVAAGGAYTSTGAVGHSMALKSDRTLWAWGRNSSGQLGDGTGLNRTTPIQIGSDSWTAVAAGGDHSLSLKSDGTLWAWGDNRFGQLGDGTAWDRTPVKINNLITNNFPGSVLYLLLLSK